MPPNDYFDLVRSAGAYVSHAHPFREDWYIEMIRLLPRKCDAVEIINSCRKPFENEMAKVYADSYGLPYTAGSDNHHANQARLSGIETEETIELEVIRMDLHLVNTKKRLEAYLLGHPLCKSAVNENGKITKASIEYRLRIIRTEESVPESLQEDVNQLKMALELCGKISDYNKVVKELNKALDEKCRARYETLTDEEVLDLLVNRKWFDSIFTGIADLYAAISHRLTNRIVELAERYENTLPELQKYTDGYETKVKSHLERMGFKW